MTWEDLRGAGTLFNLFLAALGAIAGSFASAAIHRIPREDLTLRNPRRSCCPSCGHQLAWFENLPILSFLALRGRCRSCRARIGWSYPANEAALALLFLAAGHSWAGQAPLSLLLALVVLTSLWIAAGIDFRHFILPDGITLGGIPFGLMASALVPAFQGIHPDHPQAPFGTAWLGLDPSVSPHWLGFLSGVLGGGVALGSLLGLRALFSYLLRQEALGLGDVKYLGAVGCLVGLEGALWCLLVGVVTGAGFGFLNILRMILVVHQRRTRRGRRKTFGNTVWTGWLLGRRIPFGPPLVLGTMLMVLAPGWTRGLFLETWPRLLRSWLQ